MKKVILCLAIIGTLIMAGCGNHQETPSNNPNEISNDELKQIMGGKTSEQLTKENQKSANESFEKAKKDGTDYNYDPNKNKCMKYDWNQKIYVHDDNDPKCN